jgi:hypothetical protein
MSKSGKSKKPITIEEIVKEIRKMEKNKDEQQLLKMAQKSTEQERKRMDRLSQTRKSVEKYLSVPKKSQKKIVLKTTNIQRVSPPASGYKYRYFEPKEIFQKAMEEDDTYMMKNAMDRGVFIDLDLLPDQESFHKWITIYKPKSKSDLRKHLENLKEELENEISEDEEDESEEEQRDDEESEDEDEDEKDEDEKDEDEKDEEEEEKKAQKLAYYLNVLDILKETSKRK